MGIKINIENYEAYLLDLSEGNLSYAEEQALIQFLAKHPEIEVDLEDLPILEEESISIQKGFRSQLYREASTGLPEKDHLMISAIEGELSAEEKQRLGEILQSDEDAQNDLAYYHKTILPSESIQYPHKEELIKKESRLIPLWTTLSSVAAAILFIIYFGLAQENDYTPRTFSYDPVEQNEEAANFAFVIAEEKENKSEEKPVPVSQLMDQTPSDYLAEEADKSSEEDPVEAKEEKEIPGPTEISPIDRREMAELDNQLAEMTPVRNDERIAAETMVDVTGNENKGISKAEDEKVLSPLEYAREVIKKDVLKNRTLAESVKDEVESLTNKKVNFEQAENESDAQFALNIGKLKFRKK